MPNDERFFLPSASGDYISAPDHGLELDGPLEWHITATNEDGECVWDIRFSSPGGEAPPNVVFVGDRKVWPPWYVRLWRRLTGGHR